MFGFYVKDNFLFLHCSLTSSMVIRDLTLRSAASFGSFHLIRLLYDEYMYFLIEHRVAQAKGVTPIAVMGEVCVHTEPLTYFSLHLMMHVCKRPVCTLRFSLPAQSRAESHRTQRKVLSVW